MTAHEEPDEVAALRALVDRLTERLDDVSEQLRAELAGVPELQDRLAGLDQGLEDLYALVTEQGGAGAKPRTERAWWWPALTAMEAGRACSVLGAWVRDVLLARHPTYTRHLRPCWRLHADVVDELTALRVAWCGVYLDPKASPIAASDYYDRRLPTAMHRVEKASAAAQCRAGAHSQHTGRAPAPGPQWTPDQVAAFIAIDTATRLGGGGRPTDQTNATTTPEPDPDVEGDGDQP